MGGRVSADFTRHVSPVLDVLCCTSQVGFGSGQIAVDSFLMFLALPSGTVISCCCIQQHHAALTLLVFGQQVTHLIAGQVGSTKYKASLTSPT